MNNSHCRALRRRHRGEAAPSGEAASWLHWKGKVTVLRLSAYILPAASLDMARRAWETPTSLFSSFHYFNNYFTGNLKELISSSFKLCIEFIICFRTSTKLSSTLNWTLLLNIS
jgi:hypothetical protein